MIQSVSFIGAGNVAHHLAIHLKTSGIIINEICSKRDKSAEILAQSVDANMVSFKDISNNSDLYIVAISDDQIEQLDDAINFNDKLVVHTSGSVSIEALSNISNNIGVFYPLQTLSKDKKVNFAEIPICIEANSEESKQQLNEFFFFDLKKYHEPDC